MRVLTPEQLPPAVEEWLESRRRAGLDKLDEVWDGVVHLSPDPAFPHADVLQQLGVILDQPARTAGLWPYASPINLGRPGQNFRIPDGALTRERIGSAWADTAALVIEVVSPGDDSWNKFDYFAAHGVDEVLIADPHKRTVDWFGLQDGRYEPLQRSGLIPLGPAELAAKIDWPPLEN